METVEPSPASPAPSDEEPPGKSFFEKLKSVLGFRAAPDTTEELEHEIQELLEEGEEQGLISVHEERLINSIFDFRETIASEIMTPSAEMVCADLTSSMPELIRLINEQGYTRIPIYKDNPDQIVGILHAKDLLSLCARGNDAEFDLKEVLNPATFIPESKPITELLREFQSKKIHMAIVVDEFGGVRGLVTLEDVIEEIVGEIDDEHDDEDSELRVVDERTVIVDAKIDIEEVEAHFRLNLPEGPYESVGGFIIHRLGKVPPPGVVVEENGLSFKVLGADPRRIKSVRIVRNDEIPPQP
ncbi:CBS domain containing protein [Desulfobulbus propionicus DSM 2032]|jgi:CBS domain containing-hemolysin-like protein|uniref:CBS domain containing protein n=1 Tax=Desulfobulbus propionicus (strain ATCC 33891 / DSM 2032 / VKM B-1956 / 1pr3) TaxID=577650 RepID=A0A7U3YPK4_DESPD|nr:hemolysin family protein [Desulfobulbus propionicus]ADW19174.1 CBS domain containing protein [Desulfobulbus propionicus DSM 2032]